MSKLMINAVIRHKLYWYKPTEPDDLLAIPYPSIDVGMVVAQFISSRANGKHIGLDVEDYFKKLISEEAVARNGFKGIALTNIGILLEPDLSLNLVRILLDLSKEYVIILVWHYLVENSRRLFWDDGAKASLDFPEQTIQRLEIQK